MNRASVNAISYLPASVLWHLAALAETRERESSPWSRLNSDAIDEAVDMAADGIRPALGWWRHHLPKVQRSGWPTPIPLQQHRRWQPWELVAAAVQMADDHVDTEVSLDVLESLALIHGLEVGDLADAYRVIEEG